MVLVGLEARGRALGREEARLDTVFADAMNAHKGLRAASLKAQRTIDSLAAVVERERSRRVLEAHRRDSLSLVIRRADSALAQARLAGDSAGMITAQDVKIRELEADTTSLSRSLASAELEITAWQGKSQEWEKLAGERLAVADSLAGALETINEARVCHMLGVRFLPRCPSRTVTAVVTAVVTTVMVAAVNK